MGPHLLCRLTTRPSNDRLTNTAAGIKGGVRESADQAFTGGVPRPVETPVRIHAAGAPLPHASPVIAAPILTPAPAAAPPPGFEIAAVGSRNGRTLVVIQPTSTTAPPISSPPIHASSLHASSSADTATASTLGVMRTQPAAGNDSDLTLGGVPESHLHVLPSPHLHLRNSQDIPAASHPLCHLTHHRP